METNNIIEPPIDTPSESKDSKTPLNLRKFFLIGAYFASIPVFLTFLVLFSLSIKYDASGKVSRQARNLRFQALPVANSSSSVNLETSDARIKTLEEFFGKYNSPLKGHSKTIVAEADRYNIDFRLLPAIAMQESTLCKKIIKDSFNCWGFGIYGKKITRFDNYDQAIKVISATISKKYVQKGYVNPEEIVLKYTPSDSGRWPEVVSLVMQRISNAL